MDKHCMVSFCDLRELERQLLENAIKMEAGHSYMIGMCHMYEAVVSAFFSDEEEDARDVV